METSEATDSTDDMVEAIKKLRQGEPLSPTKIQLVLGVDGLDLFGVKTSEELFGLIGVAIDSLVHEKEVAALKNALGLGLDNEDRSNLTVRRGLLLEEVDITMRALQNREDAGAEMIARQFPRLLELQSDDAEIVELKARVAKLERQVYQVSIALGALIEALASSRLGTKERGAIVAYEGHRPNPAEGTRRQRIESGRSSDGGTNSDTLGSFGSFDIDIVGGDFISSIIVPDDGLELVRDLRNFLKQRRKRGPSSAPR